MSRLSITMCLVAFYFSLSTIGGEGQSLMTSFAHTLEVYWESYLTFPNDAKTCKLSKRGNRSNWIPNGKLKRSVATLPFGFDLVTFNSFIHNKLPARAKCGSRKVLIWPAKLKILCFQLVFLINAPFEWVKRSDFGSW